MRKRPLISSRVRQFFAQLVAAKSAEQRLIDETEDRMVNGPPLTDEQKKLRADLKAAYDLLNKAPLKPAAMYIPQDVYDDIVKWSGDSPPGEGQVE